MIISCTYLVLIQILTRNSSGDEIAKRDFLHILASHAWVRPWDNHGKCYMDGKRIQCWSKYSSIYPSIFNRLRAIARYWSEIATFPYPLAFNAPVGGDSIWRSSWFLVSELPDGQAAIWCKNIPEMLNPLSRVHARHRRQTDRQTDLPYAISQT